MKKKNKATNLQKVGKRLKDVRRAKDYSSAEKFTIANDLSRVQYARYENGGDLYMSTFFSLLERMEITPEVFFAGFSDPETDETPEPRKL